METIINLIKVNEKLFTSGQPTKEQFDLIAASHFDVVINLALATSENRLEDEDDIVTSLSMNYFHIPVDFETPTLKNLNDFLHLLYSLRDKKVWVHCMKNYRVSAFMYVYHKYIFQTPFDEINLDIFNEWQPSTKWQDIMKTPMEQLNLDFIN